MSAESEALRLRWDCADFLRQRLSKSPLLVDAGHLESVLTLVT
jgi:hypothetical protein